CATVRISLCFPEPAAAADAERPSLRLPKAPSKSCPGWECVMAQRPPPKKSSSIRPPPTHDGRPINRLLAALPADDYRRLHVHLTSVAIRPREVFHKAGEPFDTVYFINGGVASITTTLTDGTTVE